MIPGFGFEWPKLDSGDSWMVKMDFILYKTTGFGEEILSPGAYFGQQATFWILSFKFWKFKFRHKNFSRDINTT